MKAHELAYRLRSGPDIEVVYAESREDGYYVWGVDELVEVDEEMAKYPENLDNVPAPYIELQ